MRGYVRLKLIGLLLMIALGMSVANGQDPRGQIVGRVMDPSGAVVAGAPVKAVKIDTDVQTAAVTNHSGDFVLPFLLPGTYKVLVSVAGFKEYLAEGVSVPVAGKVTLNITLELGQTTQQVVVQGVPLVEAATASMGQVVDERRITEMPLKDGNPIMLWELAPGALNLASGGWSRPFDNGSASSLAVNGTKTGATEYTMDGVPNDQTGGVAFIPPPDAVEEVKIQTATFDSSLGYTQGAVINVSLKSGTNQLHGSAHEFVQNSDLNATDFFNNMNGLPKTPIAFNRWGATVGGPVYLPRVYDGRNRTFWTYSYEGIHDRAIETARTYSMPTAAERQGDFSALLALGANYQIYNPFTTTPTGTGLYSRTPFAGNIITPSTLLNSTSKNLLGYLSPPNQAGTANGTNNFYFDGHAKDVYYTHLFRIDQNFSEKNHLFVRGDLNHRVEEFEVRFNGASGLDALRNNQGIALDDVYTFSPSFLMNAHYGYTRYWYETDPLSLGSQLTSLGFSSAYQSLVQTLSTRALRFPDLNIVGNVETSSQTYGGDHIDVHDLGLNFTKIAGPHALRFGMGMRAYQSNGFGVGQTAGYFTFDSSWDNGPYNTSSSAPIGQGLAAFLLGLPSNSSYIPVNASYAEQSSLWSAFLQDDWKITSKLIINLGLRYEVEVPTHERYNRTSGSFDSTDASPLQTAALANYALNPISQVPVSQFKVLGGIRFAGVNGQPRGLWSTNTHNFMPRVSAAYALNSKTVVRGGFGMFYDQIGLKTNDVNQQGFSRNTNMTTSNDNGQTYPANLTSPFPSGYLQPYGASLGLMTNAGNSLSAFNPNLTEPYSERWEFSVQRELARHSVLEVAYVGNHGRNLLTSRPFDPIPRSYMSTLTTRDQTTINLLGSAVANPFYPSLPGTSLSGSTVSLSQLLLPYPQFTGVSMQTNEGYSWYNSLQVRFEKRLSAGLTTNVAYTWSKFIEASTFLNQTDAFPERVISSQDRPQRLVISSLYELPFGKGRKFASNANPVVNKIIGGWQVQHITQFQSGSALGFGNALLTGTIQQIPLAANQRTIHQWFNISAFNRTSAQQLASNIVTLSSRFEEVRGPGLNNWDISALKNFSITERVRLQFQAEFINAFNHAQYSNPNASPTSGAFGQITTDSQWPRVIEFGLKLLF
ncbi:MAG: carboxypeptidase regulatory-like domain-containing protein [Terriglobia bacterium]|jgi:hypothetical protein